jgi:hypothetical protein
MKQRYCLSNTETEEIEGFAEMTDREAQERNEELRANGEPQRWVQVHEKELYGYI